MKTIFAFFLVFFIWQISFAQITVIDSIPVLITDTQSINENFVIPYSIASAPDSLPIFYEKKDVISDTASIWCRNLRSLSPEKLFLQSGNGIIFREPFAGNNGFYGNILWCESNFQGQFDIYGFRYDNNFNITDTFRITNDTIVETHIFYSEYDNLYWIQKNDSLLIRQSFLEYPNSIYLVQKDTIDSNCISAYPNFYYTKFENDSVHLYNFSYNLLGPIDTSGNVNTVNISRNDTINSIVWENNDSIFSFDSYYGKVKILINYYSPYSPYLPAIYSFGTYLKDIGYPIIAFSYPDSNNILNISTVSSGSSAILYFSDIYSSPYNAFQYKFPQEYKIEKIRMFYGYYLGNTMIIYTVLKVRENNYEDLYFLRFQKPIIGGNFLKIQDENIILTPNPTSNQLNISITDNNLHIEQIEIFDIMGKQVKSLNINAQNVNYNIDVKKLPAGVYFVKVETNKGSIIKKFVKQ